MFSRKTFLAFQLGVIQEHVVHWSPKGETDADVGLNCF